MTLHCSCVIGVIIICKANLLNAFVSEVYSSIPYHMVIVTLIYQKPPLYKRWCIQFLLLIEYSFSQLVFIFVFQSASSPKDVIVLVDVSGSVQGLTMNLFYHAVRHLLDTLTANDFVNIVLFNEEAKLISDKCTGLLQATSRNKQVLIVLNRHKLFRY